MKKTKNATIGRSRELLEQHANRMERNSRLMVKHLHSLMSELESGVEQDKQEMISQLCHELRQYPCRIQGCLNAFYLETDSESKDAWLFLVAQSTYEMLEKIDQTIVELTKI